MPPDGGDTPRAAPIETPCRSGEVRSRTALRAYAWCVATHLHIAHRGYRTGLGDNTIAQLQEAIRLGADMIEVDMRRRRSDGELVLDRKSTRLNSSHT